MSTPRIVGALLVRDAVDIVRVTILHQLALGLESVLVTDNGSTDGTRAELAGLARRLPVEVVDAPAGYDQAAHINGMAATARQRGADWVLPFDVDEFFVCPRGLGPVLAETDAAALAVPVVNFVQRRRVRRRSARALLTMDARPEVPLHPLRAQALVRAGRRALVEREWEPSVILRAEPGARITLGNHGVEGAAGPAVPTTEITCLHAPLRARAELRFRRAHARRIDETRDDPELGWHVRALAGELASGDRATWRANSNRRGRLDVAGTRRPLVRDTRLRDAVAPWIED